MTILELFRIKTMWVNYTFDYACSLSRGFSGGLISVWDPNFFLIKDRVWCDDNYIIVKGKWVCSNVVFFMVNVYGPNDPVKKRTLWDKLCSFIAANEGEYVCFGDFNEVRDEAERFGSIFHTEEAAVFNTFIANTGLVDIPLNGRRFTWVNNTASKMSRIDRVLINPNVLDIFADLKLTTLPRGYSDHLPLLLQDLKLDFGPSPFKCFNSWLLYEDFDNIVLSAAGEVMCNMELSFHEKMKHVKSKIRALIKDKKANEKSRKAHLMERIDEIEKVLETGNGTDHIVNERKDLVHELDNIQQVEDLDVLQKCRIKWDAEGNENSRYFHCFLKQHQNDQTIKGVSINGDWIVDPILIKEAFFTFIVINLQLMMII
ncbi:uncharacterized protein [Rutidosis leptorrhynchoides]|uniref:uncharacterized protein n=1 Tax=Rutidosis leptorrhynchoides TaxID=125765 RepID=UPI003A99C400